MVIQHSQAADFVMRMLCPACRCPLEAVASAWMLTLAICLAATAKSVRRHLTTGMLMLRRWTTLGPCPNQAVGFPTGILRSARIPRYLKLLLLRRVWSWPG